jgi:hypothetical protein
MGEERSCNRQPGRRSCTGRGFTSSPDWAAEFRGAFVRAVPTLCHGGVYTELTRCTQRRRWDIQDME